MTTDQDAYAPQSETSQGRVFTVTGQDWDSVVSADLPTSTTTRSWSTWVPSTPRPTACSG